MDEQYIKEKFRDFEERITKLEDGRVEDLRRMDKMGYDLEFISNTLNELKSFMIELREQPRNKWNKLIAWVVGGTGTVFFGYLLYLVKTLTEVLVK